MYSRLLACVFLCLALISLAGCGKPADPSEPARAFFQSLSAGKPEEAYQQTGFGFQAQQSFKAFETNAKETGLIGATDLQLEPPSIEGSTAKLNAQITNVQGVQQRYIVTLQKDGGEWRVYSLKTPPNPETGRGENRFTLVGKGAAFHEAVNQPVPDDGAVKRLIREAMSRFADAIQQGTFGEFYKYIAVAWQAQLTERQLQRAFQAFIDRGMNLTSLARLEPVLDVPPHVTSDGLLMVEGHYPTEPYQVHFTLKFIYELPTWKLFGIDVNLRK